MLLRYISDCQNSIERRRHNLGTGGGITLERLAEFGRTKSLYPIGSVSLPKLISGEIRVKCAEQLVEAVL